MPATREALATPGRRIDLAAVSASLRRLQRELATAMPGSGPARDPCDDRVVENLEAGYAHVDALVAGGVDVFAMGNLRHVLELNTIVLCGTDPARRSHYARHVEASEERFYDHPDGGVRDLVEWYRCHAEIAPWERAAGVAVCVLSHPQLFIEGNHRTAALLMSYVLVRAGQPPFVLTPKSAAEYFDPSAAVRDIDRNRPATFFRLSAARQRLAKLLAEHADPRHLLP
jgi:hypothetical protein